MAKVNFVKSARKDIEHAGIKKGESYYWWQANRFTGKQYSKTQPKPSQTASTDFERTIFSLQERIDADEFFTSAESAVDDISEITSEIESMRDEEQEKLDNMPEGFQQGPTGERIQERIDQAEQIISELESIDVDFDPEGNETAGEFRDRVKNDVANALAV